MVIIDWVLERWIEIVAVSTGIAYIFLSVKQNIWCWLFGIVSSGLYLMVFFSSKIYADMALQAYYVAMGVYGWIHWARVDEVDKKGELPVTRLNKKRTATLSGITLFLFFAIALFLIKFTDSPVPWVDAFTTSLSFTATYMLARKILEHWLIWVVVNVVSIGLYFYRGLYPSIILFAFLTILAVIGYFEWKNEWKKNKVEQPNI